MREDRFKESILLQLCEQERFCYLSYSYLSLFLSISLFVYPLLLSFTSPSSSSFIIVKNTERLLEELRAKALAEKVTLWNLSVILMYACKIEC